MSDRVFGGRTDSARLHQLVGTRGAVGVQEVARQWGIAHLGNFATDYRRLFGASPSETTNLGGMASPLSINSA